MAAYLNDSLSGHTLEEARLWIEEKLKEDRANYDRYMRAALMLGGPVTRTAGHAELYVERSSKALEQPEFAHPGRLRELLRALADKSALLELLERSLKQHSLMASIRPECV